MTKLFSEEVGDFYARNKTLCKATLGLAIAVFALGNLAGRAVKWIRESLSPTEKKTNTVSKSIIQNKGLQSNNIEKPAKDLLIGKGAKTLEQELNKANSQPIKSKEHSKLDVKGPDTPMVVQMDLEKSSPFSEYLKAIILAKNFLIGKGAKTLEQELNKANSQPIKSKEQSKSTVKDPDTLMNRTIKTDIKPIGPFEINSKDASLKSQVLHSSKEIYNLTDEQFQAEVENIAKKNKMTFSPGGFWIFLQKGSPISPHEDGKKLWTVFLNPKPGAYLNVLERAIQCLEKMPNIDMKVCAHPSKPRKSNSPLIEDPNEPKLLFYFYGDNSPDQLVKAIQSFKKEFGSDLEEIAAPQGKRERTGGAVISQWGPSFTKKLNPLIFYNQGGYSDGNTLPRRDLCIGRQNEEGVELLEENFEGENYYLFKGTADPIEVIEQTPEQIIQDIYSDIGEFYAEKEKEKSALLKKLGTPIADKEKAQIRQKLSKMEEGQINRQMAYLKLEMNDKEPTLEDLAKFTGQSLVKTRGVLLGQTAQEILSKNPQMKPEVMQAELFKQLGIDEKTGKSWLLDIHNEREALTALSQIGENSKSKVSIEEVKSFLALASKLPPDSFATPLSIAKLQNALLRLPDDVNLKKDFLQCSAKMIDAFNLKKSHTFLQMVHNLKGEQPFIDANAESFLRSFEGSFALLDIEKSVHRMGVELDIVIEKIKPFNQNDVGSLKSKLNLGDEEATALLKNLQQFPKPVDLRKHYLGIAKEIIEKINSKELKGYDRYPKLRELPFDAGMCLTVQAAIRPEQTLDRLSKELESFIKLLESCTFPMNENDIENLKDKLPKQFHEMLKESKSKEATIKLFIAKAKDTQKRCNIRQKLLKEGKPVVIPKYFHATKNAEIVSKIVQTGVEAVHASSGFGSFVSTKPEFRYGPIALGLPETIQTTSAHATYFSGWGTAAGPDEVWEGLKEMIVINPKVFEMNQGLFGSIKVALSELQRARKDNDYSQEAKLMNAFQAQLLYRHDGDKWVLQYRAPKYGEIKPGNDQPIKSKENLEAAIMDICKGAKFDLPKPVLSQMAHLMMENFKLHYPESKNLAIEGKMGDPIKAVLVVADDDPEFKNAFHSEFLKHAKGLYKKNIFENLLDRIGIRDKESEGWIPDDALITDMEFSEAIVYLIEKFKKEFGEERDFKDIQPTGQEKVKIKEIFNEFMKEHLKKHLFPTVSSVKEELKSSGMHEQLEVIPRSEQLIEMHLLAKFGKKIPKGWG